MRRFEFQEGGSNKFWEVELAGASFTVCWGRIGSAGQRQTKRFADAAKAGSEHDKLVAEKLRKGYREVSGAGAKAERRGKPATAADGGEEEQARSVWSRIESWVKAHVPEAEHENWLAPGASAAEIARTGKALGVELPAGYKASCRLHDGCLPVPTAMLLPLAAVLREWRAWKKLLDRGAFADSPGPIAGPVGPHWFHSRWVPIASHQAGDIVVLDLAPSPEGVSGQVVDVEHERSGGRRVVAWDFLAWLGDFAQDLEAGAYLYDAEIEDGLGENPKHRRRPRAAKQSPPSKGASRPARTLPRLSAEIAWQEKVSVDVHDLATARDGSLVAASCTDGSGEVVKVWDRPGRRLLSVLEGHEKWIRTIAFSQDGRRLATGGSDRLTRVWDPRSGRVLAETRSKWQAQSLAFSPEGLVVAGMDGRLHRLGRTGKETSSVRFEIARKFGLFAFAPDGRTGFSICGNRWDVWDVVTGKKTRGGVSPDEGISVAIAPDGLRAAVGNLDGDVVALDTAAGAVAWTRRVGPSGVLNLAWSWNGQRLFAVAGGKNLRVHDAATGEELARLGAGGREPLRPLALPDGGVLVTTKGGNIVELAPPA